jgi:lipase maturation factor 1
VNGKRKVASPPERPVLIFDGDCNFCRHWIRRWQRVTGDRVEYVPYQEPSVSRRFPELPRHECEQAVQLITADGNMYHSAEAVFLSRAYGPGRHFGIWAYRHIPGFASASEFLYRIVARHRTFFSRIARLFFGEHCETQ